MSFTLYAIDHVGLETLVLRVLKAIGDRDRKAWKGFLEELRRYPCSPFRISSAGRLVGGRGQRLPWLMGESDEGPMTARTIPRWDDPRLAGALLMLTQLSARNSFAGGEKMLGWLIEMPLRDTFATDAERAEFEALDGQVLRSKRPWPRHLEFLNFRDAYVSYLVPGETAALAQLFENGGYLRRVALGYAREAEAALASDAPAREALAREALGRKSLARFLVGLRAFVLLAASQDCALYYHEHRS